MNKDENKIKEANFRKAQELVGEEMKKSKKVKDKNAFELVYEAVAQLQKLYDSEVFEIPNIPEEIKNSEAPTFNEVMFVAKHARKFLWLKRAGLTVFGRLFLTKTNRIIRQNQLKKLSQIYKTLKKYPKELKYYCSMFSYVSSFGPTTWNSFIYNSGDNVSTRFNAEGRVEKRIGPCIGDTKYVEVKSAFYRLDANKKTTNQITNVKLLSPKETEEFMRQTGIAIAKVFDEMCSTGSYKGQSDFVNSFFREIKMELRGILKQDPEQLGSAAFYRWKFQIRKKALEALEFRRKLCTKNSKSSSENTDDDSQT